MPTPLRRSCMLLSRREKTATQCSMEHSSGSTLYAMGTLQRVLTAAARLVIDTRKYDRGLSTLIHDQLHWLNVPERVEYKLAVMVRRVWRTKHQGIWSVVNCYTPVADVASRHRRSANLDRSAVSTQHTRSAGLLCRGSDRLEYTACRTAWTGWTLSFGAHWRRSCLRDTSAPSAIEMLCVKLRYIINLFWHLTFDIWRA